VNRPRSKCNINAEIAKRDASGFAGRKNFQRDAFLQSLVCGINLHEVSAEKKLPAKLEARRASEKCRGCLCVAISYSRLLAVNLHTTKESKVRAEGLGEADASRGSQGEPYLYFESGAVCSGKCSPRANGEQEFRRGNFMPSSY
jgi:hypothetical protein